MSKNLHVIPRAGHWAVRDEGKNSDTKQFRTQYEAIEFARQIARKQSSELIIYGRDGKIRERNNYRHDPYSPVDTIISNELAPRLRQKDKDQLPPSEESLQAMIDSYQARAAETDPLEAFLGMFDDDITDLSSMTKEDVLEAYRNKYGDSS